LVLVEQNLQIIVQVQLVEIPYSMPFFRLVAVVEHHGQVVVVQSQVVLAVLAAVVMAMAGRALVEQG
jgi:hypothetical protein